MPAPPFRDDFRLTPRLRRGGTSAQRNAAFAEVIGAIPRGRVASYGQVAAAAGYPNYHRAVARFLQTGPPGALPWHRVLGADGKIKLTGGAAAEQRYRLKREGVTFTGAGVEIKRHRHDFAAD